MGGAYPRIIFTIHFVRFGTKIHFGFTSFKSIFAAVFVNNIIIHYEQLTFSQEFN